MADTSPHAENIKAVWGTEPLRGLWARAREALESPRPPATFRLELPDEATRQAVGDLYGRPLWGQGTRISLSKLDEALRQRSRFGLSLAEVLEILHDKPISQRESPSAARDERKATVLGTLSAALAENGLANAPWARPWSQWVYQYGRIADDDLARLSGRACQVLSRLVLDPARAPEHWASRADLASRFGGGAHELDNGMPLSRLVLRAAVLAHGKNPPSQERERRELWELCGVTLDAVSATLLCWALPITGDDDWSDSVRRRTNAGLPTHVTHLDLLAAPLQLVEPGSGIAICENPRILEAAVRAGIRHPLLCISGHPSTVASEFLRALVASGAILHYHGDFDWAGVSIARSISQQHGAHLWRMSAADYREALQLASADRIDLPALAGERTETPWDPELSELMATAGRAIEEETVLPVLLDDLHTGL